MFCSNCGAKLKDGTQFCTSCGKKVMSIPSGPAETKPGQQPVIKPQGQAAPPKSHAVSSQVQSQTPPDQNQGRREQAAAMAGTWDHESASPAKNKKGERFFVSAAVILILILSGVGAGILFYKISGIGDSDSSKNTVEYGTTSLQEEEQPEEKIPDDETGEPKESESGGEDREEETTAPAVETTAEAEPATCTVKRISQVNLSGKVRAGVLRDTVEASSYLVQSDKAIDNSGWSAFDGDSVTSWQEGVEGNGIGEYIGIRFDREYQVEAITLLLGNHRSDDLYVRNNVPKTLIINLDGQVFQVTFPKEKLEQVVEFSRPVPASSIRLTVQDVYPGTEYTDTIIAEVGVYGQ